jgi:hypothetical protein
VLTSSLCLDTFGSSFLHEAKTEAAAFSLKSFEIFLIGLPDLANWLLHEYTSQLNRNRPVTQICDVKSAIGSLMIKSFTH